MPTYRIEEARTGRAKCKNKECSENNIKILKGELRLGSWVETEQFQSWAWKHWGCVTPKQVTSMQKIVGENGKIDMSVLDGYDELSHENQEKISEAVNQGHVADSDWRGDTEVNRPGKTGFRVKIFKASGQKESLTEEHKNHEQPAKRPRAKRSARKYEKEKEEEKPMLKKAKYTSKKKAGDTTCNREADELAADHEQEGGQSHE